MMFFNAVHDWKSYLLRGIAALLFGIFTLIWPSLTVFILVILFAVYVVIDGIFLIAGGFRSPNAYRHRWLIILQGVLGVIIGIAAFIWPGITAVALLYLIGAWAVITGIIEIVAGINMRKEIRGEGWMIASGVLSVILGILLMLWPFEGIIAVALLIGIYALIYSGFMFFMTYRARRREPG
jgi:uncharacterized membrane protein HdeD (DUF308 family)